MTREVGPRGLAAHIGENVFLDRMGADTHEFGQLVYAIQDADGNLIPVSSGDVIGLRHAYPLGSSARKNSEFYLEEYSVK